MAKKLKNIPANPHPAHYMMHKYWGRKPHNVVSEYIRNYTKEGDTVLDPFMGSGVTIIESVKLLRSAIGIDLNPLSSFIARNTLTELDINEFDRNFYTILENNKKKFDNLYITKCPDCNGSATLLNCVYEEMTLLRVKGGAKIVALLEKMLIKLILKLLKK